MPLQTSVLMPSADGKEAQLLSFEEFAQLVPDVSRFDQAPPSAASVSALITAFYGRYSTKEQKQSSLERQFDNCASMAASNGSDHRFSFADPEATGTNMDRRALKECLRAAERKEFARLIVEDVDRLSRKLSDLLYIFEYLKHHGIELWDSKHGKLDFVHVVIFGFMAQQGRERMSDLLEGGKIKAIAKGKLPGRPRLGYKFDGHRPGFHIVDPDWEERVLEIFRLIADGVTAYQVAKDFNVRYPARRPGMRTFKHPDPNRPVWTPALITSIVRNYIYVGFFLFKRKQQVRDFATNKVTGAVDRPKDEIVIAPLPHLAFVPSSLWARANHCLNLRQGTKRGARPRGLLYNIAVCKCGSGLTEMGKPPLRAYRCISNASVAAHRCKNSAYLPVAAVQAAAITALRGELTAKPGSQSRFRRHMEAEMRADQRRFDLERKSILEQLAAIKAENDDTWNNRYTENRTPEWLADRRTHLNREDRKLRAKLTELNAVLKVDDFFKLASTVADGMAELLDELPFEAKTAAEVAAREGFRSLVSKIVVNPPVKGIAAAELTLRRNAQPTFDTFAEQEQLALPFDVDPKSKTFTIAFSIDCQAGVESRRKLKKETRDARNQELALSGRFDLPQAALREVRRAIKNVTPDRAEPEKETKRLMDGLMFAFKAPCAWDKMPPHFGEGFLQALQRFRRSGRLDKALDALKISHPKLVEGLDLDRLDITTLRPSLSKIADEAGRTRGTFGERDGISLLEASDKETDPLVKSRKRCVGNVLCGMTHQDAAKREGVSLAEIARRLAAYRADPEHGLDRVDRRGDRVQLDEDDFKALAKLFEAAVDPRDPDKKKPLDWEGIMFFIKERRPKLTYNKNYISTLLRDHKLSLAAALAAARERGR